MCSSGSAVPEADQISFLSSFGLDGQTNAARSPQQSGLRIHKVGQGKAPPVKISKCVESHCRFSPRPGIFLLVTFLGGFKVPTIGKARSK